MLYNTLNIENVSSKVKKNIQDAFGCFLSDDAGFILIFPTPSFKFLSRQHDEEQTVGENQ